MASPNYEPAPEVVLFSHGYIPCDVCGKVVKHEKGHQFNLDGELHNWTCPGYPPDSTDILDITADLDKARLERDILRNAESVSEEAEIRRQQTLRVAERQVDELEQMLGRAVQEETGLVAMVCESNHRWNGAERWCPKCGTADIARDGERA